MANKFTNFLSGVFNANGNLRDFQHAARLYQDDFYKLAPKAGWLYYVVFNINSEALASKYIDQDWLNKKNSRTVGILAKSADMPTYTIKTEMVNQYNRKTYVQTGITYNPIRITFHDDMANVTTNLWKSYYNYYYADGNYGRNDTKNIPAAFANNKLESGVWKYGLNNGQNKPFFDSIIIYTLNKQKYNSVTMLNPLVNAWSHGKVDQSSGDLLESTMGLNYEAVMYNTTNSSSSKLGFTDQYYDRTKSPLRVSGNNSIFGENGILSSAGSVFGSIDNVLSGTANPMDILNTALQAKALVNNIKSVSKAGLVQEGFSLLSGGAVNMLNNIKDTGSFGTGIGASVNQLTNPVGVNFFKGSNTDANGKVTATPKTINGGP